MNDLVRFEFAAGIARLTLNRPDKRNALRREILQEMLDRVRQVAADDQVRLLVLSAAGKVFCAGMDLGQMQERAESADSAADWQADSQVYCDLLTELVSLRIPSVACVQGPALAGGVGLVLACDMVLAAEAAFFMLPEPMRGITAAMVTPLLLHRLGPGPGTFMLMSNERISAEKSFGLCHIVVPQEQLEARLQALTQSILSGSRSAFSITKSHIDTCVGYDLARQLQASMGVSAEARATADAREGLAAFLEKRKPAWQPTD